jgi:glycosyltransferase involved in cell wall biosynthesis
MRPWLIASGDFTTLGGMDRANHGLAQYLARTGRPVHLVAHRVAADLAVLPGLTVHSVPRPLGAHMLGAPLLSTAAVRQARALGGSACVLANGGNAVFPGATWVHYVHAAHAPASSGSIRTRMSSAIGRGYYLSRERAAMRTASLVICNSERTASDVERYYRIERSRLRVIYYGVDQRAFTAVSDVERAAARAALGLSNDRLTALFIGALGDRRKGFDVLFDAWRAVAADPAWDVDLLVAGTGGERDAWMVRARDAGLQSRMTFLGFRQDVASLLAASDLLVHPARYEAYGLGVHEAICRGVPAIVTDGSGVAERYPKTLAGLIISNPPNRDSLIAALRAWRSTAAEWRARVARFATELRARTWDDMAAEIVETVES